MRLRDGRVDAHWDSSRASPSRFERPSRLHQQRSAFLTTTFFLTLTFLHLYYHFLLRKRDEIERRQDADAAGERTAWFLIIRTLSFVFLVIF